MFRTFIAAILATLAFAASAAVDVNKATQAELETVKGIGPALSGKILDARKSGQFKDWNDLVERVGGVGAGNAKRFSQAGLTVGGSAFDGAAAPETGKTARKSQDAKEPKAPKTRTDKQPG